MAEDRPAGDRLKVLMLSAEVAPYAKVGGLADVVGSLPLALTAAGHEVVIVMPRYGSIDPARFALTPPTGTTPVTLAGTTRPFGFYHTHLGPDMPSGTPRPRLLLADNAELFGAPQVYGLPNEHARFFTFCRAALQWCTDTRWQPDIVHCHDWHTAIAVHYLRYTLAWDRFWARTRTVFTIHNLAYQGTFGGDYLLALADLDGTMMLPVEYARSGGAANPMARGISEADVVTTVSPTYRDETLTPALGEGLDGILRDRGDRYVGILNGIDTDIWNPARDAHLAQTYTVTDRTGKAADKAALQREAGLPVAPDVPLIGIVARLAEQKGFDLVARILPELVRLKMQIVVLGTGDLALEEVFRGFARTHPRQVAAFLAFDAILSERIYAGADMFLMPSRFEPCGLGQMIAMRYGTIPIVRKTGGLADSVPEYDPQTEMGMGFLFEPYDPLACFAAITRALDAYRDTAHWDALITRAMYRDATWAASAREYIAVYRSTGAGRHNGDAPTL